MFLEQATGLSYLILLRINQNLISVKLIRLDRANPYLFNFRMLSIIRGKSINLIFLFKDIKHGFQRI